MTKAGQFIQNYTRGCSNELIPGIYHDWLTPEQARRAVEIAREELINAAIEWIRNNARIDDYRWIMSFRNEMNKVK